MIPDPYSLQTSRHFSNTKREGLARSDSTQTVADGGPSEGTRSKDASYAGDSGKAADPR